MNVKLYECYETTGDGKHWFSIEPAYNPTHPTSGLRYDDYSCGEPREYVLPDGFKVAETVDGIPMVYDADDYYCELTARYTGGRWVPVLSCIDGFRTLKAVE